MIRKIAGLCVVLAMVAGISGPAFAAENSPVLSRIVTSGELRVGMSGTQPPFSVKSKSGELIGYDVDLANLLAAAMDVELKIVEKPFAQLLPALEAGEVVSLDRLVEINWPGDDAPVRAEHNVRSYVHRLRVSLGSELADRIETIAPGYRLHLRAGELDAELFDERKNKLAAQYNGYEVIDGLTINGEFTSGENIGDLGGLGIAYKAYHISLEGKEAPVIDGLTGDQRFFLGWAQVWRGKIRDEEAKRLLTVDPHSPAKFRTNGATVNIDEFYQAFDVKEGDGMYLPPEDRVKIW